MITKTDALLVGLFAAGVFIGMFLLLVYSA